MSLAEIQRIVAVNAERILEIEKLVAEIEERLKDIEGDRRTITLLIEQVKHLTTSIDNFYKHAEDIAELAVEKVFLRHQVQRRDARKYWLGWASFAAVAAGLVVNTLFVHLHFHL